MTPPLARWDRSRCAYVDPCDAPATVVIDERTGIGMCARHGAEALRLALTSLSNRREGQA